MKLNYSEYEYYLMGRDRNGYDEVAYGISLAQVLYLIDLLYKKKRNKLLGRRYIDFILDTRKDGKELLKHQLDVDVSKEDYIGKSYFDRYVSKLRKENGDS